MSCFPSSLVGLAEELLDTNNWNSDLCIKIVIMSYVYTHTIPQPTRLSLRQSNLSSFTERTTGYVALMSALSELLLLDSVNIHNTCGVYDLVQLHY